MQRLHPSTLLFALAGALASPSHGDSWIVNGEPYMGANANTFTISDSSGTEDRNRAVVTVDGVARNLAVMPSSEPNPGSQIRACLRLNGDDTAVCATYGNGDGPGPVYSTSSVDVAVGDVITVHLVELNNVDSGANVRTSFQISSPDIFADSFESSDTSAWPGPGATAPAMVVTGEPFVGAATDVFTIGGTPGAEPRSRAAVPRGGTLRNLFLLPNQEPVNGGVIRGCLRVDGVDTSLCVDYDIDDWPNPKGNTATTVAVSQGALVTVHVTEQGTGSNANVRASFALDESGSATGAVVVVGEPFLVNFGEVFSIGAGSPGEEHRNRAGIPQAGTIRNLFVVPDQVPALAAQVRVCIRVNGADTALCVLYLASDGATGKGNTATTVPVVAGDFVTVHFEEIANVSSAANYRASFELR